VIAGGYTARDEDVIIDGAGSMTLRLGGKDSALVAVFVKSLPDIGVRDVWSM